MRRVILKEGDPDYNGRVVKKGAIYVDPKKFYVPMAVQFDHGTLVGRASLFHRNLRTGELSMELEIHPNFVHVVDMETWDPCVFLHPFVSVEKEGATIITSGLLREVTVMPPPPPGILQP